MLVSIIIPTFNRCGKLQRAVDSVLHQSFSDFELIVVDDGSNDATGYWMNKYDDDRLLYTSIPNSGVAAARNYGARIARGDWLCFLDSDDVWHRHKLSEQIRFHAENPEIQISQTDDIWIRDSVRVNKMKKYEVREGLIFQESLRLCLILCSSVMIQKSLFFDVGGFDENFLTCEDYDLWIRILARFPIGLVKKKLVTKFGGHADQLSRKFPLMDKYRLQSLKKLERSPFLNAQQQQWVEKEIQYKESILKRGAKKREGN